MVALISLLSAFERPWPTVNFCGLETNDHCNIVYRLSYYGINTNNKYHGREAASIYTRSCHFAYLRPFSSRKKLIYRTTTAAIYACRKRRVSWLKLCQANWFTRIYLEPVESSRQPATDSFRVRLVTRSTPMLIVIDFTVAPRCSVASSRISAQPADVIRSGVQSMPKPLEIPWLTESKASSGQGWARPSPPPSPFDIGTS